MLDFISYTISVLYVHGTGRLLNVLNNSLKEVTPPTLLINLITLFCNFSED